MKNVLIFGLGGGRYAIELRWVREIFTLGPITPVPSAPAVIAGAVNFRGAIVPVLAGTAALAATGVATPAGARAARAGDAAVLLDIEGTRAALGVDRIDAVTTLTPGQAPGTHEDPRGEAAFVLDPPAIVAAARRLVGEATGGPLARA